MLCLDGYNNTKSIFLFSRQYPTTERGDLLVFLSGMSDIMTVIEAVRVYAQQTKGWIVQSLHSALSIQEQDQVSSFTLT